MKCRGRLTLTLDGKDYANLVALGVGVVKFGEFGKKAPPLFT